MQAIHGGKAQNDTIDAHKIAVRLRGGMLSQAYVYPAKRRATRDLLRRRMHLVRQRAAWLPHLQQTNSQYHLPEIGKTLAYTANQAGVTERFPEPAVQNSMALDLTLIDAYDRLVTDLELELVSTAKAHEAQTFDRLRSIPGVRKILALVLLYEIPDITRFPQSRRSCPSAASSRTPKAPPVHAMAPRAKRSAMRLSHGLSPKPPCGSCAIIWRGRSTWHASSEDMAKARP
jgi:transposase